MPGYLLHVGATVVCAHTGKAEATMPNLRVKVSNQQIVTQPEPYAVVACKLPPQGGGPCATAQWTTAATRVKAGNMAVLLQDSQATCAPTTTPLTIATTQMRVKGI
jgi:hypothetical protein